MTIACKTFYKFVVGNENLTNDELANKIVARFAGVTYVDALDLVQTTRQARKVSDNLVERKQK